jgi:hypothetical protein
LVPIGKYGFFTSKDDYALHPDAVRVPLQPVSPEEMGKIEGRLYEISCGAKQMKVAQLLTYLLGKGVCTECQTIFSVSEQIISANT